MADQLNPAEVNISSPELKTLVDAIQQMGRTRFHKEAREHFIVENLDEINPETLLEMIHQHENEQVVRLKELLDYFENNNHGIINRKAREQHLSDVRSCHPFASFISGFIVGYIGGEGIKVTTNNKTVQELIKDLNFNRLNLELLLDCSIFGRAYDLVYRSKKDSKDRAVKLDPIKTFVIYDDTVEMNPLAGVRYRTNKKNEYIVDFYTDRDITRYSQGQDGKLIPGEPIAHFYKEMPITEYNNNRFRQGDFEKVLDLIDLYDFAQSDMANYSVDLNNAMLVLLGDMKLQLNDALEMKNKNTLLLVPAIDEFGHYTNVDAKYIYKQYDVAGTEAYKQRVENDIHKFTNTPDMNDDKFAGNQSGEAMKYKLFGMEQERVTKQAFFTEAARRRYGLILNLRNVGKDETQKDAFNIEDLDFIFTPNIPKSFYEEVKAFIELGGKLSQETILTLISFVKDPQDELKRISKESDEAVKKAQEAFASGRTFTDIQMNPNNNPQAGDNSGNNLTQNTTANGAK